MLARLCLISPGLGSSWIGLMVIAYKPDDKLSQLTYSGSLVFPNIENAGGIAFRRQDVCLHHILDEGEIPGLLTVAKNNRRASLRDSLYKFRDDSGILGVWVLPWTIHIEIS